MIVEPGTTGLSIDIQIVDDTGLPVTGLVAATLPAIAYSKGSNAAATSITLSDLAAITTAHPSDNIAGGVFERAAGWYRLDIPNNALTNACNITLIGTASNKRLKAEPIEVRYIQGNVAQWRGTAVSVPTVAGVPNVNVKTWNDLTTVALPLVPTTAGRTLDVSAGGEAGIDWGNIGNKTTTNALTNTTVSQASTIGSTGLTAIVDAVLDEATASHVVSGSVGEAIGLAGLYVDPLAVTVPGGYSAGSLGYAIGEIETKTANLPSDPADASIIAAATDAIMTRIGANGAGLTAVVLAGTQTFNNTGTWTGSVGSIAGVTFPTNFSVLSISATTGLVNITQTAADKVWTTGSRTLTSGAAPAAGAYFITTTVTDGTDPLQGATVRVTNGVNSYVNTTDASGNATFSLDALTFNVSVTKAGYSFTPTTRTVTGVDAGTLTDDLEMDATVIPSVPAAPDKGTVYGSLIASDSGRVNDIPVTAELVGVAGPYRIDSIMIPRSQATRTAANGQWSMELYGNADITPAGTFWRISIPQAGFQRNVTVVSGELLDIDALIE